jgi:ketosteroid isomerase-like protein
MRFALLLLCVLVSAAGGQTSTSSATLTGEQSGPEHSIQEMENSWGEAVKNKDSAALDNILAEDRVGRYPYYTLTKNEELEHVRKGDFNITSLTTSDLKIRVFGDAAVVTGSDDEKGSYNGKDTSGRYLWMDVLIGRNETRKYVASGQTLTASSGFKCSKNIKPSATKRIRSSAIWGPPSDFLTHAHAACVHSPRNTIALCFIGEMVKAGAPDEAVQFSRRLYQENGGEFGFMWDFQALGPVDMAKVNYPLREGSTYAVEDTRYALLLVNGDPPIIDVDDLKKLDKHGMEQDAEYQLLKRRFHNLELFGAGRSGTKWESVHKRSDGGQSFDIYYVLNPERPAGSWLSGARYDWNFDANGKFLGANFTGGVGLLPD